MTNISEKENIQKTLDIFIEGIRKIDYEIINEIFYENGLNFFVNNEDKICYDSRDYWKEVAEYYDSEGLEKESTSAKYTVRSLTVIENTASVIIDFELVDSKNEKQEYTNLLHMVKANGKWFIVSRLFPTKF
jgi:hypothetical protein